MKLYCAVNNDRKPSSKKSLPKIKKLPEVVRNAQWALDSAVVRGASEEELQHLRMQLLLAEQSVRKI